MAPRAEVDDFTKRRVFDALKYRWADTADALADRLNLDRALVLGALGGYTQAGRAIYDLNKHLWRVRELSREPLPMDKLRFANPREESATRFVLANAVAVSEQTPDALGQLQLRGTVRDKDKLLLPSLTIDRDERMTRAECSCNWYLTHKLYKGPCEHMLALRMHQRRR